MLQWVSHIVNRAQTEYIYEYIHYYYSIDWSKFNNEIMMNGFCFDKQGLGCVAILAPINSQTIYFSIAERNVICDLRYEI